MGDEVVDRDGVLGGTVDAHDSVDAGAASLDPVDVLFLAEHHFGAGIGQDMG